MSDSYEVYVHEGHITEIERSAFVTTARVYGEDWNSPPTVNIHAAALAALVAEQTASPALPSIAFKPPVDRSYLLWLIPTLVFAAAIAAYWVMHT